jgi:hypothetical protein
MSGHGRKQAVFIQRFSRETYGKVVRAGNLLRVLTDETKAQEISYEALKRKATISISSVTLDDVFVELVGSEIDRDSPGNEQIE